MCPQCLILLILWMKWSPDYKGVCFEYTLRVSTVHLYSHMSRVHTYIHTVTHTHTCVHTRTYQGRRKQLSWGEALQDPLTAGQSLLGGSWGILPLGHFTWLEIEPILDTLTTTWCWKSGEAEAPLLLRPCILTHTYILTYIHAHTYVHVQTHTHTCSLTVSTHVLL